MFRLRSKSGDESVFRTAEEIRSALLSGYVTTDAQIWDAELKGWVPLLEHSLYQQISAVPGGRKSGSVKAPPASPGAPKAPPKLVIKRPGAGATTAIPQVKIPDLTPPTVPKPPAPAPPPPAAKPAAADEVPDLELIDLDLTPELEPDAPPPPPPPSSTPAALPAQRAIPAKRSAPFDPAPPKRSSIVPDEIPTAPIPEPAAKRLSAAARMAAEAPAEEAEPGAKSGSKMGLIIAAAVVLAAAGGGFVMLRGKGTATPPVDTAAATAPVPAPVVPPADSVRDTTKVVVTDTTHHDSTAATPGAATHPDSAHATPPVVVTPPAARDTATPVAGVEPVPFAPTIDRGPASWNAQPIPPMTLSVAALEVVRSRYSAAQARAAQQYEASLEVAEFTDMFDPAKSARPDKRQAAFDAIDAARGALRDFRRRQAALDFAYTDSLRRALPPGSDDPDLRTFGPILRETPPQAALTDSLVSELFDMYGLLINEAGNYSLKNGSLYWKDPDSATQYRTDQERLTAQLARLRTRSPADLPPAMAGILRGIGLPR